MAHTVSVFQCFTAETLTQLNFSFQKFQASQTVSETKWELHF